MTRTTSQLDRLFAIAQPVCIAAGYELVDVRLVMEPGGWVLRVFLDRLAAIEAALKATDDDDGATEVEAISLADCERMSRELGTVLDVEDPIPQAYSLEVSSPGLDRPLRTAAHFRRFAGETAKITLAKGVVQPTGEPRRNYKGPIVSVEPAAAPAGAGPGRDEPGATVVIDVDGTPHRLPIDDIETARVVPDWDAVLGVQPRPGKSPGKSDSGGKKPSAGAEGQGQSQSQKLPQPQKKQGQQGAKPASKQASKG